MIKISKIIEKGNRDLNSIGVRMENADWYDYVTRALRELKKGRTLPYQKRTTNLEVFTDVNKYSLPSDFSSFIKPNEYLQNNEDTSIDLSYTREQDFYKNVNLKMALSQERDKRYLLMKDNGSKDNKIDTFDDEVSNYTISGDGSNLVKDTINFKKGSASLRFDIVDNTNTTTIERTLNDVIDITDYLKVGKVFLNLFMGEDITDVSIRYGNDNANYYEISNITSNFNGDNFITDWNLLAFDMNNAVETGSVDNKNIDYITITINNAGVSNTFRLDSLYFRNAKTINFPYNSTNLIEEIEGNGNFIEELNAGTNVIVFDDEWTELLLFKAVELAAMFKFRDNDLIGYCRDGYVNDLIRFNNRFPSNEARVSNQYFRNANKF